MADVGRLFAQYKEAHRGDGVADPSAFLSRVSGSDREELAGLIDVYLAQAPRREFSAEAFRDSPAAPVAESVQRSLSGEAGLWPALLPRLRNQARIKRADLVFELASRLGAEGQQEKVGRYYHQMEQGLLPASGVSDTVLEALGKIVGYTAEALRRAGELPAAGRSAAKGGAVFARMSRESDMEEAPGSPASAEEEWDEVDRLFRSG